MGRKWRPGCIGGLGSGWGSLIHDLFCNEGEVGGGTGQDKEGREKYLPAYRAVALLPRLTDSVGLVEVGSTGSRKMCYQEN